jgi:hypothetical protein
MADLRAVGANSSGLYLDRLSCSILTIIEVHGYQLRRRVIGVVGRKCPAVGDKLQMRVRCEGCSAPARVLALSPIESLQRELRWDICGGLQRLPRHLQASHQLPRPRSHPRVPVCLQQRGMESIR